MQWYEAEVRQLEAARSARQLPSHPVVFYGSSSIRLWNSLADDLRNRRALNLGFGGSTLEACAYFFERLVVPLRPCSLVLYAGDNDLGDGRSPKQVLAFLRALTAKMDKKLPHVVFTFMSIKPSPARSEILNEIREANILIRRELEARKPCALFVDTYSAMLDHNCKPRPDLFTEDGLHMNRHGYRVWTDVLSPYRHRIFAEHCSSVQARSNL